MQSLVNRWCIGALQIAAPPLIFSPQCSVEQDFCNSVAVFRWQEVRLVVASSETRGQSSNSIVWQPPFGRRERERERGRETEPRICTTSDTLRHTDIQANIHREDFQGQSICTTMLSSYSKRITSSRQTVNH